MRRLLQNEPNRLAGGFIALQALLKAGLQWGGIEMPAAFDTALQMTIAAWVGLIIREQVAPIEGPQNATVKAAVIEKEAVKVAEAMAEQGGVSGPKDEE